MKDDNASSAALPPPPSDLKKKIETEKGWMTIVFQMCLLFDAFMEDKDINLILISIISTQAQSLPPMPQAVSQAGASMPPGRSVFSHQGQVRHIFVFEK